MQLAAYRDYLAGLRIRRSVISKCGSGKAYFDRFRPEVVPWWGQLSTKPIEDQRSMTMFPHVICNKHNAGHLYLNDNKRVRIMMSKTATTTQTTRIFTQNYLGGKRQKRLKHIED